METLENKERSLFSSASFGGCEDEATGMLRARLVYFPTQPNSLQRCRLPSARLARCSSLLIGLCSYAAMLSTDIVWLLARLALNNLFSSARFPKQLISAPQEPSPVETPKSTVSREPGSSGTVT